MEVRDGKNERNVRLPGPTFSNQREWQKLTGLWIDCHQAIASPNRETEQLALPSVPIYTQRQRDYRDGWHGFSSLNKFSINKYVCELHSRSYFCWNIEMYIHAPHGVYMKVCTVLYMNTLTYCTISIKHTYVWMYIQYIRTFRTVHNPWKYTYVCTVGPLIGTLWDLDFSPYYRDFLTSEVI